METRYITMTPCADCGVHTSVLFSGPPGEGNDFQSAAVRVAGEDDAAAIFYLEAVRERRLHPGITLDDETIRIINRRVAARLYEIVTQ